MSRLEFHGRVLLSYLSLVVKRKSDGDRGGSSTASQLSDILNKDARTLTFDLDFDHQDDVDFYKNYWRDIITRDICALSDHVASSLSILADVCAALSCEALKIDPTTAFNSFTDSGDGFSDKDRASVASDFKVLLHGSKMCGDNRQCIDVFVDIPRTHGLLRSLCKSIHFSTLVKLNYVPLLHGRVGKDLTRFFLSLAYALESLCEASWQQANLCLDNLGTCDFSNEQMAVKEKALSIITNMFESHGAMALDTPVFEL
nr:histidine--tRNA ligase, cytoplasmic [Tanacetum cinerariifolium]